MAMMKSFRYYFKCKDADVLCVGIGELGMYTKDECNNYKEMRLRMEAWMKVYL